MESRFRMFESLENWKLCKMKRRFTDQTARDDRGFLNPVNSAFCFG
ncbi:hypothetical protein HOLDEFILI_01675 [Holdemania filiformis DSM 12042]|uniref:Uncharacterized protein n=1 Tax=Holdemania filiformis DSM 12042 TaxID=545696 RepID=B9Y780_9FIRM|nr:hypothetical protein HOLDEFILI_01675 [Holdemania filiformis DSM 12042]